jgi:rare lipoprotein A
MSKFLLPALTALLFLAACSTSTQKGPGKPAALFDKKPMSVQHGKASYYYGRWIGRKTANGERYRASDITAAHRKLPFNTFARVTNLRNGKSVIVRINNRGPYIKGRIIDLSLEAARAVDMTKAGVVNVKIEVLKPLAAHQSCVEFVQSQRD